MCFFCFLFYQRYNTNPNYCRNKGTNPISIYPCRLSSCYKNRRRDVYWKEKKKEKGRWTNYFQKGINEQLISNLTFSSPHVISRPKAKPGCSVISGVCKNRVVLIMRSVPEHNPFPAEFSSHFSNPLYSSLLCSQSRGLCCSLWPGYTWPAQNNT